MDRRQEEVVGCYGSQDELGQKRAEQDGEHANAVDRENEWRGCLDVCGQDGTESHRSTPRDFWVLAATVAEARSVPRKATASPEVRALSQLSMRRT